MELGDSEPAHSAKPVRRMPRTRIEAHRRQAVLHSIEAPQAGQNRAWAGVLA